MPRYDTSILDGLDYEHPYLTQQRGIRPDNLRLLQVGYDAASGRVILPVFWHGDLVGWQTRMVLDDGGPKYKNTPAFPKNETLYHAPDTRSHITVVESVMSVVSKVHLCPDMVATFGASVTDRQKHLLAGYPRVTLWFDNDPAGWKATLEVGEFLLRYTDVFVVDSQWAADPADLDDETFSTTLANVVPFSLWQQPTQLKEAFHGNP
jgi:DNA primase